MDSVTLLHYMKDRISFAVSFDYGSKHNAREIECARKQCEILGIRHLVLPLKFMEEYFRSSLLTGGDAIPEGSYDDENMKSTVVPFRNGIMLSVACGLAENSGLKHVMMANHGGDHSIYPDCRPDFVEAMSDAMKYGTYEEVTLLTPFTHLSKGDIAAIGKKLNVDYSLSYSCYCGGEKHCGKCGTCTERKEALAFAGIEDPTEYEE